MKDIKRKKKRSSNQASRRRPQIKLNVDSSQQLIREPSTLQTA